jgi:hypothetical protein
MAASKKKRTARKNAATEKPVSKKAAAPKKAAPKKAAPKKAAPKKAAPKKAAPKKAAPKKAAPKKAAPKQAAAKRPAEKKALPPKSKAAEATIDRSLAGQRAFVAERVKLAKLEQHAGALDAALSPSIRLVRTGSSDAPIGGSRLGGLPDLPEHVEWPRGPNAPLSFIGQIDLADVAPSAPDGSLPKEGLLSFFYDIAEMPWGASLDERASVAVLYSAPGTPLARRDKPRDLVAPHQYAHVELTPTPVRAEAELTLPFPRTKEFRALGIGDAEVDGYWDDVWGAMTKVWPGGGEPFHRMLGHADAIQGDMTRRVAYLFAGKPDAIDRAPDPVVEEDAKRLRLLLQIDTDDDLKSDWGGGRLFYWIREDDLAQGRFDASFFQFQT